MLIMKYIKNEAFKKSFQSIKCIENEYDRGFFVTYIFRRIKI